MLRTIILPIFRSTRLCNSLWYNAPTMLPAGGRQHRGKNNCPKHVELTGIINKTLLLHLVGCLYYLYFIIFFLRLDKQSQFIPLQNVVFFITLPFMVRKIFTFYINDVLLFKCPVPGPKGLTLKTLRGKTMPFSGG